MNQVKIVLVGPNLLERKAAYGGGVGGIVSAAMRMLDWFKRERIEYIYFNYSVRRHSRLWFIWLPARLLYDFARFVPQIFLNRKGSVLHIMADGGMAAFRTLIFVGFAKALSIPIVCDVRGNALTNHSLAEEKFVLSIVWDIILFFSNFTLVQSKEISLLLNKRFAQKVLHHPNWLDFDINRVRGRRVLCNEKIEVVFVGYCYSGKGVFDAVEGCQKASDSGLKIRLTLIGHEELAFKLFCDDMPLQPYLEIQRLGKLNRQDTLDFLFNADVFLFPSYHAGEGHPNVINEAMYAQLVIVTTRVGVIGEILDDKTAFFVTAKNPSDIAAKLIEVSLDRSGSAKKGLHANKKAFADYSEDIVLGKLADVYRKL